MIIRKTYEDLKKPLTPEQTAELEALEGTEPEPDEECPAYSLEKLKEMKRMADERRAAQQITLRLSPAAIDKAKSYGSGYISILSQFLENALNNNEIIRKSS